MKAIFRTGCILLACALTSIETAAAQPANLGCTSDNSPGTAQTLHCQGGVTIVVENGARYALRDRGGKGHVDTVELSSKALLIEVLKKSGEINFRSLHRKRSLRCAGRNGQSMPPTRRLPSLLSMGGLPLGG